MTRATASRHFPVFKSNRIRIAMHIAVANSQNIAFKKTERSAPDEAADSIDTNVSAANDGAVRAARLSDSTRREDAEAPKRRLARNVVGPRLRAARETSGLQQADAARRLGYTTSGQLSQHEQGKRLMPIPELIRAAEVYGTTVDYILGITAEDDRDPTRSLRAATVRGLRGMLDGLATGLVDAIGNHARFVGPNAVCARSVVSSGQALLDALAVLLRQPEFDEMKGGAAVARTASEFEARLHDVRHAIEKFDRLDLDLRERIANAVAANDAD